VLYVEPGEVTVSASFVDQSGSDEQVINAQAGGRNTIRLRPQPGSRPAARASAPAAPARAAAPVASRPAPAAPAAARPAATRPAPEPLPAAIADAADEGWPGITPVVFFVALGSTAVLGGVTIWSGVDTMNNPGEDVVRETCRGLGPECPAYQEGRDKQTRTNVLIGVTAGVAALTAVVGLFLTDWSWGDAQPASDVAVGVAPDGASLGVRGGF
jgi:hypothetical protein